MMMMIIIIIMIRRRRRRRRRRRMMTMMMMTTTTTIILIIIIIIALKGAIRYFYSLPTAPRTLSNTHAQVVLAQSCANHVQHIQHLSCATYRVPLGTKGQLS